MLKIFDYDKKESVNLRPQYLEECRSDILKKTKDPKPWNNRQIEEIVETDIPENGENVIFHTNFLEYLEEAYSAHYNIVVSPHIVWYTVLSELTNYINNNIEECRALFTRSTEKTEIAVDTGGDYHMPLDTFITRLREHIPLDLDLFLKDFSTSTRNSKMACMATFCEAVSPYYNYMLFSCGFNRIKIDGTREDWQAIIDSADALSKIMPAKCSVYLKKVKETISSLLFWAENNNAEDVKRIFYAERCGSGSQTYVYGWIHNLFMKSRPDKSCNFPSHIAKVPYSVMGSGKYNLCYGLFASQVDKDGFLVPEFYSVINKVSENDKGLKLVIEGPPVVWQSVMINE